MTMAPIAVSIGDPAGIGPDVIVEAANKFCDSLPDYFVVGDPDILQKRAEQLKLSLSVEIIASPPTRIQKAENTVQVLPLTSSMVSKAGQANTADAHQTIEAITTSVDFAVEGHASAVVTCPINKKVLYDAGFDHPGHTEYLAELAKKHVGKQLHPVMMLAGPDLRTVPVTIHIPLKDVISHLTTDLIVKTCEITHTDLRDRFGIQEPRLAICGLNPHAGEENTMGFEDSAVILPAVEKLRQKGLNVIGPLPADTMFHARAREAYDVAICMYHDQALIPAKTLAFDNAVNVTLGLPFIRTSPDHGTAYDIAGKGIADPSSYIAALKMAEEMSAAKNGKE